MFWTFSLCLVLNICTLNANILPHHISHHGIRSADGLSAGDFADQLFKKYGNNAGKISLDKFGNLLKNLGIGENVTNNIGSVENNCFTGSSLLRIFSLNATGIDKASFQTVCPAIVQQIDSTACKDDENKDPVETKESKMKAWGYGFLSVGIISAASLLGAFVVPFMSHTFYKKLLLFMVSLAVGVLGGSGIFHLLPNTFGLADSSDVSFLYKSAVVVGGIYFFFLLEYTMKLYIRHKEGIVSESNGHGHSHGLKSMQNGKSEIPGQGIAAAQLELYKYKGDPKHDHTSGGLIIDSKLNRKPDANVISGVCSQTTTFSNSVSEESITIKEPKKEMEHNKEKQHIAPVAWMIVIGDAVHNFIDGLAIGAAYSTSVYSGLSTALAIFCEELPHELGDFAVLLNGGMNYKQAMCFNFFSACSCFLGLVIGLLLGYSTSAVKWIYALAGGMFLYISLVDMLQEATEMSFKEGAGSLGKSIKMFALQGFGMLFGFAVMFILAMYQNNISI